MKGRLGRLWRTVRRLRPIQWRYRAWYALRRRVDVLLVWRDLARDLPAEGGGGVRFRSTAEGTWAMDGGAAQQRRADCLIAGEFTFANETRVFKTAPEWLPPVGAGRFWEYNLHYFDFALDLIAAWQTSREPAYLERLGELLRDWMQVCAKPGTPIAWDAGPLSHRLKNWSRAVLALGTACPQDRDFDRAWAATTFAQASYLERHLEFHLMGNHLITNGAALLFAGSVFEGKAPTRWQRRGLKILRKEFRAQFLADGGHEERSPMYHALMLKDYLDCLELERHLGAQWFDREDRALISNAVKFFAATLHPDGEIALLNDAAMGIAPEPVALLERAKNLLGLAPDALVPAEGVNKLASTGWFAWREGQTFLLFDAGDTGPVHNPAHAHGDTLGFECSLGGQRVIVDSGIYGYGGDEWQAYCQSTRAHNTVMLDGEEQIEKWGPRLFRAGRRPHAHNAGTYESGTACVLHGSHDGFEHLPGKPRHTRSLIRLAEGVWVVFDAITGIGRHRAESFLHFHPDVIVEGASRAATAQWNAGHLLVRAFGPGELDVVQGQQAPLQGWYCPEFGVAQGNTVLRLCLEGRLPLFFGWLITVDKRGAEAVLEGQVLQVQADNGQWTLVRDTSGKLGVTGDVASDPVRD